MPSYRVLPNSHPPIHSPASGPHVHVQRIRCLTCGTARMIPCPPISTDDAGGEKDEEEDEQAKQGPKAPSSGRSRDKGRISPRRTGDLEVMRTRRMQQSFHSDQCVEEHGTSSVVKGAHTQRKRQRFHEQPRHGVWAGPNRVA